MEAQKSARALVFLGPGRVNRITIPENRKPARTAANCEFVDAEVIMLQPLVAHPLFTKSA
jgi:hypothetical protein